MSNKDIHEWLLAPKLVDRAVNTIPRTGIISGESHTVYVDQMHAAWLFEDDGFLHPIPTVADYQCFIGARIDLVPRQALAC